MKSQQTIRHCPDGYPVFRVGCQMKWRNEYCRQCPHGSRFSLSKLVGLTTLTSAIATVSINMLSLVKS
ncbi:MAG: hypothetical protein HQL74_12850 [Magnetococcales bacterium]|nr:hypothetical protein [Magnetococcales bacterium]